MARAQLTARVFFATAWLALAPQASALTLTLDDFEDGDTVGWITSGDVSVVDALFGTAVLEQDHQVLLQTGGSAVSVSQTMGDMGLPNSRARRIFRDLLYDPGLSSNNAGPTQGSAIQLTFSAEVGDTLEFDFKFLTDELAATSPAGRPDTALYTDFAWWNLDAPAGPDQMGLIAHANEDPSGFSPSGSSFSDEAGAGTVSILLSRTGNFTITLGLHDVEDTFVDSGVVFDFFRLIKAPEPDSFLLLCSGLLGLAWQSRRRETS